jgi:hypothetical protein
MASVVKEFMSARKIAMIHKNGNNSDKSFYEVLRSLLLTF